ncbi:hypothetical protein I7I48_05306 [Histoplasma ohiense]|nr:hypothetical protein I7I48_05306 [Histoplasma ohiense (nom. inval.)]
MHQTQENVNRGTENKKSKWKRLSLPKKGNLSRSCCGEGKRIEDNVCDENEGMNIAAQHTVL